MDITRRTVLAGMGAGIGTAALGCGDNGGPPPGDPDAPGPPPDADLQACTATSALTPRELLAGIDTIVVLCMENRSFDHYLGSLRLLEGRADVDGLTGTESNPDPNGVPVPIHLLEDFTVADPPHEWDDVHLQWNNGALDGFVRSHAGPDQNDVMGYHVRSQLPITYALADQSSICHQYFCSALAATWVNRFYLHAATSEGEQENLPVTGLADLWTHAGQGGITHLNYYGDIAWATGGYGKVTGLAPLDQFFTDAAAGTLPNLALLDPMFFGAFANDDHPDHDIQLGQVLISTVVAALGASPQWNRCLFVLTYDEHGGFFDHVAPPQTGPGAEPFPQFRRLGFRVPALVVGPTVRRGCVIDTVLEHASLASTAITRFDLPPLNARATAAENFSVCIDPRLLNDPRPAPVLPQLKVSRRRLAARREAWRGRPETHQDLADAFAARGAPAALDRRRDADATFHRLMTEARRLGTIDYED
jgi:phospholipase C